MHAPAQQPLVEELLLVLDVLEEVLLVGLQHHIASAVQKREYRGSSQLFSSEQLGSATVSPKAVQSLLQRHLPAQQADVEELLLVLEVLEEVVELLEG
jgi:hypothetical protein